MTAAARPSLLLCAVLVAALAGGGCASTEDDETDAPRRGTAVLVETAPGAAGFPVPAAGGPGAARPAVELGGLPALDDLAPLLAEEHGPRKGLVTAFYKVKHVTGKSLKTLLDQFKGPKGRILDYPELNMLVITDEPKALETIRKVLVQLDAGTPQVEIEAKVIEIKRTNGFEFGFELHLDRPAGNVGGMWKSADAVLSGPSFLDSLLPNRAPNPSPYAFQGAQLMFGTVGSWLNKFGDMDLVIQAMVTEGYAEVLSTPRIVVQTNQEAQLNTVTKIPIQVTNIVNDRTTISTKFEPVGVKLKVRPLLIGTETIQLDIHPEVSNVSGFTVGVGQAAQIPIISSRDAKTRLEVRDRETIVLGGLIEKRKINREKRVPILGSIPILGQLFTQREEGEERTEVVFILKPTILTDADKARAVLRIPDPFADDEDEDEEADDEGDDDDEDGDDDE